MIFRSLGPHVPTAALAHLTVSKRAAFVQRNLSASAGGGFSGQQTNLLRYGHLVPTSVLVTKTFTPAQPSNSNGNRVDVNPDSMSDRRRCREKPKSFRHGNLFCWGWGRDCQENEPFRTARPEREGPLAAHLTKEFLPSVGQGDLSSSKEPPSYPQCESAPKPTVCAPARRRASPDLFGRSRDSLLR